MYCFQKMALVHYGQNNFYTPSIEECETVDQLEDKIRSIFKIQDQRFQATVPTFREIFYPESGIVYRHKGAFYVEDGVVVNPTGRTRLPWYTFHNTPVKVTFTESGQRKRVGFKTITGFCVFLELLDDDTVGQIKRRLGAEQRISQGTQLFSYKGKLLTDDMVVRELGFVDGDVVHVMLSLKGGMYHPSSGRNGWAASRIVAFTLVEEVDGELSVVDMEAPAIKQLHEL